MIRAADSRNFDFTLFGLTPALDSPGKPGLGGMRDTTARVRAGAGAACLATVANAGLVVGNDQSGTGVIWDIDVGTEIATNIYSSTMSEAKPRGMAHAPSSNTVYWNNGTNLDSAPYGNAPTPAPRSRRPST